MTNRILPIDIKEAYSNTGLLSATFAPFNKKSGRCAPLAALYANYKKQKFIKNQRFHLFYDWDSALDDIEEWLSLQYKNAYLDGWTCGFMNDDELTSVARLENNMSDDFILGFEDGCSCLSLFEPIANKNQVALIWRQSC